MHEYHFGVASFSDNELLSEVPRLAGCERRATAQLITSLAELDARRLYLKVGCASLFTYCTQILHLSEHAAYGRIEAARALRRFPVILDLLIDGSINLTTICLLGRHLTPDNHLELLTAARHQSKRAIEHVVARVCPQSDAKSIVRKLPPARAPEPGISQSAPSGTAGDMAENLGAAGCATPSQHDSQLPTRCPTVGILQTHHRGPSPSVPTPTPKALVAPIAPDRYKMQFTVSRETYEKFRRAQDLLRHTFPKGDAAAIFDEALTVLVEKVSRTKLAATSRPQSRALFSPRSRHVPASVKREVWHRDGARCAFVGTDGRCTETGFLEFHHVVPYAAGGETTVENVELRCRAHNAYEARHYFGAAYVREQAAKALGPDRVPSLL